MLAETFGPRAGVEYLENGLKRLSQSQLMKVSEFKDMYVDMERHHRDIKLAHLTGKPRDLREKATRDTKFYNILARMLCEIKERDSASQREELRLVHVWYMANKHVLYSGPHFGKDHLKNETTHTLFKATNQKSQCRAKSATEHIIPKLSKNHNRKNSLANNYYPIRTDGKFMLSTKSVGEMSIKEHSTCNLPESVTKLKNVIHPIASLVNPHTALTVSHPHQVVKQPDGSSIPPRAKTARPSRSENLQAWQMFNKKRSYGQEVISKLNFFGRSGTVADIRYSAHGQGQSPETHTHKVTQLSVKQTSSWERKDVADVNNKFFQLSLDKFYQITENFHPKPKSVSRMSSYVRSFSSVGQTGKETDNLVTFYTEKAKNESNSRSEFQEEQPNWIHQGKESLTKDDTGINIDTVITALDSVTENMNLCKEKLVPEPQYGFRQPSTSALPMPRETNPTYDLDITSNSVSSTSASFYQEENKLSRPLSSHLSYNVEETDMPDKQNKAKIRCISASVVDWRGKIQPEIMKYKWSKTAFGSHTYLKKGHRLNHHSAVSTSGGKRPKTVPTMVKENLKTQQCNDKNFQVIQGKIHNVTSIDQKGVESLMQVQCLFPNEEKISEVITESHLNNIESKKCKKNATSLPVMEYLSFVMPSASMPGHHTPENKARDTETVENTDKADIDIPPRNIDHSLKDDVLDEAELSVYDEDALNAAVKEELESLKRDLSLLSSLTQMRSAMTSANKDRLLPKVNPCTKKTAADIIINREDRGTDSSHHPTFPRNVTGESLVGTSLQVCKLSVSSKSCPAIVAAKNFTDHHLRLKPRAASSSEHNHTEADCSELDREDLIATSASNQINGQNLSEEPSTSAKSVRKIGRLVPQVSQVGRPIPQVSQVPNPEELHRAVQMKQEAAAAVDIQRIFRGYVARNVYKSLLSEERWRKEEARRAVISIQRMYRCHLARKDAIYRRPNVNQELKQWSRDVKEIQSENAANRQAKLASWANETSCHQKSAREKLAVIGPHVEVYSVYHPKKTGPSKHELNMAAVKIQKTVRGWLLRSKINKLCIKAKWHGSDYYKLAREYKTVLVKVQKQHGVNKPKTPFNFKDFNDFMDLRRRYESVFEQKSFEGRLEKDSLEAFFKGCGLYPSGAEIEEALDVTTRGQAARRGNQGLTKQELLDMIFYIYVPCAAGLPETRRSTWMNPIIDGQEAKKLLGRLLVAPTPLAPCYKLVVESRKEQRQRDSHIRSREEAETRRDMAENKIEKAGDKTDTAVERTETAGERTNTAGERIDTAGGRTDTAGERTNTAGERIDTAGGRTDTAGERNVSQVYSKSRKKVIIQEPGDMCS